MSIKVMTAVWEHSTHKGSDLLLLLAIADHADDEGIAYPSIPRLARKTRMTTRNVQYRLGHLRQSQELAIFLNAGPRGTHLFHIKMKGEKFSPLEDWKIKSHNNGGEKFSGVKSFQGEKMGSEGVKPTSPESSEEPSCKKEENYSSSNSCSELGQIPLPVPSTLPAPSEERAVAACEQAAKPAKKPRTVKPLEETDWLKLLLETYAEEFDIIALNDDDWWADTGNSFPTFDREWVSMAFASLARWLKDNKRRTPRTPRAWKQRMNFSLNWYYDKYQRRQPYVRTT